MVGTPSADRAVRVSSPKPARWSGCPTRARPKPFPGAAAPNRPGGGSDDFEQPHRPGSDALQGDRTVRRVSSPKPARWSGCPTRARPEPFPGEQPQTGPVVGMAPYQGETEPFPGDAAPKPASAASGFPQASRTPGCSSPRLPTFNVWT